jgi:VWFA-related protein
MPTRNRALVWISAGALAATVLPGASRLRGAQDPPQRPTFRTEANYVRVDVFPTTRDGVPVADLRQDELQILEDGVPQKIEQFEHVVIRGNLPQEARREPTTTAESRSMLQDARARVFVLFLDTLHVELSASRTIRKPLVDMLEGLLGPDDLIAVMTPQMSSSDLTFARKTTMLEGFLNRSWWGERDALMSSDPVEEQYKYCYPPAAGEGGTSAIAKAMIDRRREKLTLDALGNLLAFLRDAREERKAIIAITDGWVLFRPDDRLMQQTGDRPPELPTVNVDPRNGRLTTKDTTLSNGARTRSDCEQDRIGLAQLDHQFQFTRLLDEANRANASFYPVDPRGLAVFDTPIGPDPPPTIQQDAAQLRQRSVVLRDLASSTDGTAVVGTNNISNALKRVVADLSSYYLLGYYSTNSKLDGKFRSISVRVRRPGVQVRARRGYLAATAATETRRTPAAPAPVSASAAAEAAASVAIDAVVGSLAKVAREAPLRTQAASGWNANGAAAVWVVGEVAASERWTAGGEAIVTLIRGGTSVSTARAAIAPGGRTFRVAVRAAEPLSAGDYQVRVRATGAGGSDVPLDDVVTLQVAASTDPIGALLVRRGPATANKSVATADSRFRRSERLGVEVPAPASGSMTARLLDRTGKPLAVPVAVAPRTDADGSTWQTAELALAPLAPSDYVIELSFDSTADQKRTLVPFRIIP